jgi:hypothetical protein
VAAAGACTASKSAIPASSNPDRPLARSPTAWRSWNAVASQEPQGAAEQEFATPR